MNRILPISLGRLLPKILFIALAMMSTPAFSVPVSGIYDAQVMITDQSPSEMDRAKRLGLEKVLVKVTGQTQSLNNAAINSAFTRPNDYLKQFSFNTKVMQGKAQAVMEMAFDPLLINQLITTAGLPIWGKDRAAILVWLVEDTAGMRQIVNNTDHPMVSQIISQSNQRGMPLLWPLLDLEDQINIDAGALWGVFADTIEQASSRYQADGVLVGRMFQEYPGFWKVDWNFWLDDEEQAWSSKGSDLISLVDPLEDRLASSLVKKFALAAADESVPKASEKVILRVDQVTQFSDYIELRDTLQEVVGLERVNLHSVNGATFEFELVAKASLVQLQAIVELKRRLKPVEVEKELEVYPLEDQPVWHYTWN